MRVEGCWKNVVHVVNVQATMPLGEGGGWDFLRTQRHAIQCTFPRHAHVWTFLSFFRLLFSPFFSFFSLSSAWSLNAQYNSGHGRFVCLCSDVIALCLFSTL